MYVSVYLYVYMLYTCKYVCVMSVLYKAPVTGGSHSPLADAGNSSSIESASLEDLAVRIFALCLSEVQGSLSANSKM